jgi:hypothetical protein
MNHAIDRRTLVKTIDTILPATAKVDVIEECTRFCFRSGTINAYDSGFMAASMKIDTDIEGMVQAKEFVKLIKSSKGHFVEMDIVGDKFNFESDDGMKGSLRGYPNTAYHDSINLWDSSIRWQQCPEELSEAIWLVSFNASLRLTGIIVSDGYVAATENQRNRLCRYKLSSPSPFDMALHSAAPEIFSKLKGERLLGSAKFKLSHTHEGDSYKQDGTIFDYGDLRVWCSDADYRGEKISHKKLFPKINKAFEEGKIVNLSVLPNSVKKIIDKIRLIAKLDRKVGVDYDEEMTVRFDTDRIYFECETEGGAIREDLPINTFRPLKPMTLIAIPAYFAQAAQQGGLMGVKVDENNDPYALYFKDDKLEYVISAIAPDDNSQEKEEK